MQTHDIQNNCTLHGIDAELVLLGGFGEQDPDPGNFEPDPDPDFNP